MKLIYMFVPLIVDKILYILPFWMWLQVESAQIFIFSIKVYWIIIFTRSSLRSCVLCWFQILLYVVQIVSFLKTSSYTRLGGMAHIKIWWKASVEALKRSIVRNRKDHCLHTKLVKTFTWHSVYDCSLRQLYCTYTWKSSEYISRTYSEPC